MADLMQLAAVARAIKARSDESVGLKLAAIKAIEGNCTRNPSEVKRISQEIYVLLKKTDTRRTSRARR